MNSPWIFALGAALAMVAGSVEAENAGKRPYELDWAARTQDHCPPLVDFEKLAGWKVVCHDAQAKIEPSSAVPIWGAFAGKLTYRGDGDSPDIRVLPPESIAIGQSFDAVSLWCYGNNWGWESDPSTPRVNLSALFDDSNGREFAVFLYTVDWKEWSLLHRRLLPDQIERVKQGGKFKGLLVTGGKNKEDRTLYFDNLAVFTETFPSLQFEPRPLRGVAMLPGQSSGANTGPGRLPFPVSEKTILPVNLTSQFTNSIQVLATTNETTYSFEYKGADGRLTYLLNPQSGTWSDITAIWTSSEIQANRTSVELKPCIDGGIYLQSPGGPVLPDKAEHRSTKINNDAVESHWRLTSGAVSLDATYVYRIWNKSLVVDVLAPGGQVGEVRFGRATKPGPWTPQLITNPFYPTDNGRPAVVVLESQNEPLFLAGNADWTLSSGSILWAANTIAANGATYNGGTRYIPLANGRRNDCFERFFITLSPRYEEVLPAIPNPPSPWKHITGTRLWRAHGASNREQDRNYWSEVHRYGMTQMIVTDHETMWRDEGESFTFRTKAAPGKGGDQGAYDYARFMQDKLGFVYGPYNNFTDFAPVNEYWNFDMVSRDPQNQLQHAWMRCYAPKPARAVEYCAKLSPILQEKFKFSTAYCDVHTAVAPWHRVDYDPRAPGAGTFAAVLYSFGEIMLHQKKAWQGPVYSEGNYHCYYMGLTDGNYGQDQNYRPAENPWLVDFDLLKMHPLGCNFGMGNLEMFYANAPQPRGSEAERDAEIDRFLAATVAFGHPGFLVMEGGYANALRSYYLLQQLHSRYCLTNASQIRYLSADGRLLDTSHAVASGNFRRSQVVTLYADGTVTAANGSRKERLICSDAFGRKLDLPPNGYAGWTPDGAIEVFSGDRQDHRCDYASTPAYLYVDGRGKFARFTKAAGNGAGVCRFLPDNEFEIIPFKDAECGFAIQASAAMALDKENKEMGPAQIRKSRGLTYVQPVKGAFSYKLTSKAKTVNAGPEIPDLACDRDEVVAGETISIRGKTAHAYRVPENARPGERLWLEYEGAWIDFTVVPLVRTSIEIDGNALRIGLASHLQHAEDFKLTLRASSQTIRLEPNRLCSATFDLGVPDQEKAEMLPLAIQAGPLSQTQTVRIRASLKNVPIGPLSEHWTPGMALRGKEETADLGNSGAVVHQERIQCGESAKFGLFMHPPWQTSTGYTFALSEPVLLPLQPQAAFRAFVGKANGSDPGDGILYKLVVIDRDGRETVAAQFTVTRHEWSPMEADLSRWAGSSIRLKLIADAGIQDNSAGDWGAWGDVRIESQASLLRRHLD